MFFWGVRFRCAHCIVKTGFINGYGSGTQNIDPDLLPAHLRTEVIEYEVLLFYYKNSNNLAIHTGKLYYKKALKRIRFKIIRD